MLQTAVDIIILVGAVVMAVWNIAKFLGAGGNKVKDINEKHFEEVLDKKIPEYLEAHSLKVASQRKEETKVQTKETIDEALEPINTKISHINQELISQSCILENLEHGNSDILRREIAKIYNKYRAYGRITQYDKQDVVKLCRDYFSEHGNSYVEDMYDKIRKWEVVPSMTEVYGEKIITEEIVEAMEEIERRLDK